LTFRLCLLAALGVLSARAVELHIQYNALERMLSETVFTQDGRRYVHGDKNNKCNFAYLEKPHVRGEGGRLVIRARFTGRSALNALGVCVGLGEAFDVVLAATPEFHDGNVELTKVAATSDGKTGYYIRRVCTALSASLGKEFRYPLSSQFPEGAGGSVDPADVSTAIEEFQGAGDPGDGRGAGAGGGFRAYGEVGSHFRRR
jgi:hypothetical protein